MEDLRLHNISGIGKYRKVQERLIGFNYGIKWILGFKIKSIFKIFLKNLLSSQALLTQQNFVEF